jgi:hypothetical protein
MFKYRISNESITDLLTEIITPGESMPTGTRPTDDASLKTLWLFMGVLGARLYNIHMQEVTDNFLQIHTFFEALQGKIGSIMSGK